MALICMNFAAAPHLEKADFTYNFYRALCCAKQKDFKGTNTFVHRALELYKHDASWIYCTFINILIQATEYDLAESLIASAGKTSKTPQLEALQSKLAYYRGRTRKKVK